jgi:hypothetical protein
MLRQLRQQGSAAKYYSRFQQLSARVEWDDSALASTYYEGLSDAVKDRMREDPPEKLKDLVNQSIKVDGWLFERRMEKKGGFQVPRYANQGKKRDYGNPMGLDMMQHGGVSHSNRPSRFKKSPGNDKERDSHTIQEPLGGAAGPPGKPVHQARTHRMASTIFGS